MKSGTSKKRTQGGCRPPRSRLCVQPDTLPSRTLLLGRLHFIKSPRCPIDTLTLPPPIPLLTHTHTHIAPHRTAPLHCCRHFKATLLRAPSSLNSGNTVAPPATAAQGAHADGGFCSVPGPGNGGGPARVKRFMAVHRQPCAPPDRAAEQDAQEPQAALRPQGSPAGGHTEYNAAMPHRPAPPSPPVRGGAALHASPPEAAAMKGHTAQAQGPQSSAGYASVLGVGVTDAPGHSRKASILPASAAAPSPPSLQQKKKKDEPAAVVEASVRSPTPPRDDNPPVWGLRSSLVTPGRARSWTSPFAADTGEEEKEEEEHPRGPAAPTGSMLLVGQALWNPQAATVAAQLGQDMAVSVAAVAAEEAAVGAAPKLVEADLYPHPRSGASSPGNSETSFVSNGSGSGSLVTPRSPPRLREHEQVETAAVMSPVAVTLAGTVSLAQVNFLLGAVLDSAAMSSPDQVMPALPNCHQKYR